MSPECEGAPFPVVKVMGAIPAHVRRRHMEQWSRRYAIDSERERERARLRDEEFDALRLSSVSPAPSKRPGRSASAAMQARTSALSSGHMPTRLKLPGTDRLARAAYLEELEMDPQGVGFACRWH